MSASSMRRRDEDKKGRLPLVRCICGTEILVLPGLERMNDAIENHVKIHERRLKAKCDKEVEAQLIHEFLSSQMLQYITKRIYS